jgi:hypothetical protein
MKDPSDPASPSFDIPDLDLAPVPKKSAPAPEPRPAVPPAPPPRTGAVELEEFENNSAAAGSTAMSAYSGGSFDLGDDDEPGMKLELQSYRPPAAQGVASEMPAQAQAQASAPPAPVRTPTVAPRLGASMAPPVAALDPQAVALVAGYGPAPASAYLAPLYAYRVLMRKRALRAALVHLNRDAATAEEARNDALANIVHGLRARLEADARFQSSFAAIRQMEQITGERGAALAKVNDELQAGKQALAKQLAEVGRQVELLRPAEQAAAAELAEVEQVANRVIARHKRALIEIRSATSIAQRAAGAPDAPVPPEHAQRIAALQAQADAMLPEVEQRRAELRTAQTKLQDLRNQLSALSAHARRIQDQDRQLERQFGAKIVAQSAGLSEAQRQLTAAMAEIGRTVLGARDEFPLDPNAIALVDVKEKELARVSQSRDLHLAALDAYDAQTVKKGFLIVGGLAAAIVVAIVLLVALS